jgi:hypothetical protein
VFQNSPTDDVYHLKQKLEAIISKPAYNLPVIDFYHLKQKLEVMISKPAHNTSTESMWSSPSMSTAT